MTRKIFAGTSEPQDFQATDDCDPLDGTSWDLGIQWRESSTELSAVTVEWLDQAAGTVRMRETQDLPAGTYHFTLTLTDGVGTVGYVPDATSGVAILHVVEV